MASLEGAAVIPEKSGGLMNLTVLLTLEDFDRSLVDPASAPGAISRSIIAGFCVLYGLQLAVFVALSVAARRCLADGGGVVLAPRLHRMRIARYSVDTITMLALCWCGYEAMRDFGGLAGITRQVVDGRELPTGAPRAFLAFNAATQRLCVLQMTYQIKNLVDSFVHGDGLVFIAHHIVTAVCATLSCRPFLHLYCAYFLGWSEFSTVFLCLLLFFDKDHGVPPLARLAPPALVTGLGLGFALSFVLFRVVLWPYVNWFFWVDMLDMYAAGALPSYWEGAVFAVVSAGLTLLQFVWLGDIVREFRNHFFPTPPRSSSHGGGGDRGGGGGGSGEDGTGRGKGAVKAE